MPADEPDDRHEPEERVEQGQQRGATHEQWRSAPEALAPESAGRVDGVAQMDQDVCRYPLYQRDRCFTQLTKSLLASSSVTDSSTSQR